jgi:hypothetical protein
VTERLAGHPLLLAALALASLFHGTLLTLGSFRRTYDAYVHIFFADHYARGWFTTWEPRWYTGFTVTSYPPGTHQLVALASKVIGLEAGFVVVQLAGVLLVVIGVYRFTLLFGTKRTAGIAALLAVVATGIGEAVHVFGQLPTICSLGMLLNSLPFVRRWVAGGRRRDLAAAVGLLAGTTALHHVTTLFGTVFFVAPVVVDALLERFRTPLEGESSARPAHVGLGTLLPLVARRLRRILRPFSRAAALGVMVVVVLLGVVLPYWVWSQSDPIAQIPIPHGSRQNFLEDLNAGLVFWVIPWGPMLLALPFALWRGVRSSAWPYVASLALLTLLGTGGTTPIPRLLLGGAFDILTLDRFTFWATILVLPFGALMVESLIDGGLARRIGGVFNQGSLRLVRSLLAIVVLVAIGFTVNLTSFRRMQPDRIDPHPITAFLEQDQHWQWRYLTLGFGDQMAWLSAQTTAQSVDGNYHSARRLPELITTPVERLEGAKFRGVPGLGSLQQFLAVPEKYHLKFVFSNDQFYDPLLYFSGWRTLSRLDNGIVVWEREDVAPMPAVTTQPELGLHYRLMWGVLPLSALVAAAASAAATLTGTPLASARRRRRRSLLEAAESFLLRHSRVSDTAGVQAASWKEPLRRVLESLRPSDRMLQLMGVLLVAGVAAFTITGFSNSEGSGPEDVVAGYYEDLDFRRFEESWMRLDPATRPDFADYLVQLSVEDGLLASYASLDGAEVVDMTVDADQARVSVALTYVTALAEYRTVEAVALRLSHGRWGIELPPGDRAEPVERLVRRSNVEFAPMGRRTATSATTDYDDVLDRPELEVNPARVVQFDGHPVAIGAVRNVDADPGAVTVTAQLLNEAGEVAAAYNARTMQHSLLPGESTAYRVDFEGVAGADVVAGFHPEDFVPIDPVADIAAVDVYARATVTGRGLERPIVLRDLRVAVDASGNAELRGSILNLGVEDATVVTLLVSLYDLDGRLIWVDWVITSDAVRPGLTASFAASLTPRHRLEPLDAPAQIFGNGLPERDIVATPTGMISMPETSGYAGLTVQPVTFVRSAGE